MPGITIAEEVDILNERYSRSWDHRTLIHGRPCCTLVYEECKEYAARLHLLVKQTQGYHIDIAGWKCLSRTESSKEVMMLKLIAAQVDKVLRLWKRFVDRKNLPSIFPHVTTLLWDVELCDALDTLSVLEQRAVDMDIPQYDRLLIPHYRDDDAKCQCRQCAPSTDVIQKLWYYAETCHTRRPPALFERVFAELRRLATT